MQPFVNPYLFQNPYYSAIGNPMPQSNQALGINGKYVNDFSEVNASDVPMGGQPSIFVRNDRSEIQLREWSPNGQIVSMQYAPVAPVQQKEEAHQSFDVDSIINPIFERISELEDKLDKLAKPVSRAKKEGEQ